MKKWFLISDEDIKVIREALLAPTHEANNYNCQDWPPGEGCRGCDGDEQRAKAVYTLDSGLNTTNEIPADFKGDVPIFNEEGYSNEEPKE